MASKANITIDRAEDLRLLFETAPDLVFSQPLSGPLRSVNGAFQRATGYTLDEAMRLSFEDLLEPTHQERFQQTVGSQLAGAEPLAHNFTILTASGMSATLRLVFYIVMADGKPDGLLGFAQVVNEEDAGNQRTSAEIELLEKTTELARFSRYLQLLHRLSTTNHANLDGLFVDYLKSGCEIFGVHHGALAQQTPGGWLLSAAHVAGEAAIPAIVQLFASRVAESGKTLIHAPPNEGQETDEPPGFCIGTPININGDLYGAIVFWSEKASPLLPLHPQGREVIELMAKSIAVAINQRKLTDQLAHQATHDGLTGLPNRVLLNKRLAAAIEHAKRNDALLAVVFIDLDRFKQINDTLGHGVGDELLKLIAKRLAEAVGENQTLARMGGDEFTAILTGFQQSEAAVENVRKMLTAVRKPCPVERYELFITASMGVSYFPKDGLDAATLLRNADSAMYTAKYRGKNDLHCFSAESGDHALERLELENDLRRALEKRELAISHELEVDRDGRIARFEVLLTWDHPTRGRIPPSLFIPIAEESGMIVPIGIWVLRQACLQSAAWRAAGYPAISTSVNVSALQFAQTGFVDTVAAILSETGLNPGQLVLELTESLIMRDAEQSIRRMVSLRKLGVKIAIDDFGTGYSSLSYLRRLPADSLKIDRSFLVELEMSPVRPQLIRTIVTMAHNMGLSVTAEGVETREQFDLVRDADCDRAQGHLFGGALAPSSVEEIMRNPQSLIDRISGS